MMCLNNRKAPFDDPAFRRAVSLVLDGIRVCRDLCYGVVKASIMPVAPESSWYGELGWNACVQSGSGASGVEKLEVRERRVVRSAVRAACVSDRYIVDGAFSAGFRADDLAAAGLNSALTGFIAPPEPTYLLNALFRPGESLWKASGYESAELLKLIDDSYLVDDPAALKPILA